MAGPLLPLLLVFGGIAYLDKDRKEALARGAVGRPPMWTPDAVAAIATSGAGGVRTIRDDIRPYVLASFAGLSLEQVEFDAALLFKLVPLEPGKLIASTFLERFAQDGGVVIVSLTCALLGAPEDKLVCLAPPGSEHLAGPLGQFALLWPTAIVPEVMPQEDEEERETRIAQEAAAKTNATEPADAPPDAARVADAVAGAPAEGSEAPAAKPGITPPPRKMRNGIVKTHAEPAVAIPVASEKAGNA